MSTDDQIEQEIQAKGLTAPRVTPASIEAKIASEHYFTARDGAGAAICSAAIESGKEEQALALLELPAELAQVTICVLILRNGHKIIGVNPGPVSAKNFDPELGRKLARQAAVDQLWPLEGYLLREHMSQAA